MAQRLKTRPFVFFSCIFLWVFGFFFSPFIHYHPPSVHDHGGHVEAHRHDARIHSPELDQLAHAIALHSEESHSGHAQNCDCGGPESGHIKVELDKDGLKSEFTLKFTKHPAVMDGPPHADPASASGQDRNTSPHFINAPQSLPQERSPPVSLV